MSDTGGVPPILESLIAAERGAPTGTEAVRDHIFDRLVTTHAGSLLVGDSATAATATTTSTIGGIAVKLTVVAVIAAGAFGAGLWVGGEHRQVVEIVPIEIAVPSTPAVAVESRDVPETATPAEPAPPPARQNPRPSRPIASAPPAAQTEPGETPAARESRLLREAWSHYDDGDHQRATRALERHAETFAAGYLAEERDALWIRVQVSAGAYDAARDRARRFFEDYPESIHARAVELAITSIP